MGRRPKNYKPPNPVELIQCTRCGENKPITELFTNRWSEIYTARKQIPLCKDCVQSVLDDYSFRFGGEAGLYLLCAAMGIPYIKEVADQITSKKPPFTFGKYIRQLQMKQYDSKSFAETVTNSGQRCPKVQKSSDRLTALQEDITALREDIEVIKNKLTAG